MAAGTKSLGGFLCTCLGMCWLCNPRESLQHPRAGPPSHLRDWGCGCGLGSLSVFTCLYSSRVPEKAALHRPERGVQRGNLCAQDAAVTTMLLGRVWLLHKVFPQGLISSKQTDG